MSFCQLKTPFNKTSVGGVSDISIVIGGGGAYTVFIQTKPHPHSTEKEGNCVKSLIIQHQH